MVNSFSFLLFVTLTNYLLSSVVLFVFILQLYIIYIIIYKYIYIYIIYIYVHVLYTWCCRSILYTCTLPKSVTIYNFINFDFIRAVGLL